MKPFKNSFFWVWIATIYLIIYVGLLSSGFGINIAVMMYSLSPLVIVWMVISVLKDHHTSEKTFDEYFYEDMDWKREK